MQISSFLNILFLASFLQISFAFTCSDLSKNQCNQLQPEGCFWIDPICSGSFSPKCVPPNCYYVDSNYQGTETPDGTPGKPLKTLSDGFTKISGKDGSLIIVNIMENVTVAITKASTISSNITIKPLLEDNLYTIDFTQFTSLFASYLTIKSSLKIIQANLGLQFAGAGAALIFTVNPGGGLYFENVEVYNASNKAYIINLVRATNSTFSMMNCKFTNTQVLFQSFSSTIIWKNVYGSGNNILTNSLSLLKTMIMEDCFFTGGLGGNFLTASSSGEIFLKNCIFKDLTNSPIFTVNSRVKMTMEDCVFDRILSTSTKMFIFQEDRDYIYGVPSIIKNTSFTNIAVRSLLVYLEGRSVSLSLTNVTMKNITQQKIFFIITSIAVNKFAFPRGICCSTTRNAQLFVESSNFSNIFSHCFGIRDTNFTIKSSIFDNSQLSFGESEAAIKREETSSLDDDSGVSWINIEGTSFFYGRIFKILIQDTKFLQNGILTKSGGAIRYTGSILTQITVTGSEFIGNKAYYGGAISAENARVTIFQLENNIFVNSSAYHGGAIYKIDKSYLDTLSHASVSIVSNQFIGNKAFKNGGALYLYWDSLWISDTEFISNHAVNGGALYYINIYETENKEYEGMKNVTFIQNSASNVGGAMKLFFKSSQLKIDTMLFENNFDINQQSIHQGKPSYYLLSFYDIKIMEQIGMFGNLEDLVNSSELTRLGFTVNTSESTAKLTEIKHKSGNELAQILHVQVFDSENKFADYIHEEEIILEMVSSQNPLSNYSASLVSGRVKFTISNAKSAIKMHGEPKTTATLQFSNIEESSDFIQDSGLNKPINLQVRFIDCEEGDIFDAHTRSCLTCAAGSYSFQNPYKKASHCHQCPAQIDCYGGNQVGPKSGYWMENLSSLMAIKCPNPDACLGGYVDYEYFPNGKCMYPHQGNLCNQCAPNFAKFGSSTKCEDCKNNTKYYLKFCLFLLLQVAIILGLFKLHEKHTFYSNILKILINFVQINSILISYDLEWFSLSKKFIHIVNSFIPVNHDGFPIDCFISLVLSDNRNLTFVKLIVTFFQPFIIWGLSILAYFLVILCSAERKKRLEEALGDLFIISAFLVQPNIILTGLQLFTCQNLGSASFLTSNSEVKCWTGSHVIWSFGVALTLIFTWAILLPLLLFFKTRKNLKESSWQPFFYQGLEKDKFYWEFLLLFAKTMTIILFTVLNIIQVQAQMISTFFICISLLALILRLRPYTDPRSNFLGILSFVSLTLLSYSGFFSLIDNWTETQMKILSIFLIIVNCAVFLLPAFYIIKDYYTKTKKIEQPAQKAIAKAQSQIKEQQPKQTIEEGEKIEIKSENDYPTNEDFPEICPELNQEKKIGKIVHPSQKEIIDNFSIMQSSGLGLLSPIQMTPQSSSRLLSPLSTSSAFSKQFLLPTSPKENHPIGKGDLMQKRIENKRMNLKQFVADELGLKSVETENAVSEVIRTEMTVSTPRTKTQGGNTEFENLLKINEEKISTNV